jgi:uncharacterized membrane protein YfcA
MTFWIAAIVTFVFTTVLTIAGVGAAFVLIPVFLALGIDVHEAMATALLLNALSMSVASVQFIRKKLIDFKLALPMVIFASALSPLGARVSQGMNRNLLLGLFVAFLVFAAVMMLFYQPKPRENKASFKQLALFGVAIGGVAGFVGGLLGVGGGNMIIPVLVALGFDPKRASATTSFVVIFASFAGFLGHVGGGTMSPALVGLTAVGSIAGALLGAWLMTDKLKSRQVKVAIGVVLLAIAAKMLWGLVA